ncbi:MAG: hypothetical protein JO213_06395 [Alphaproteobacteria bacterium]|nr:hypothetical protein [Alphaproteobacteria bacterium]MBV9584500.1 hypothetical protein [Alphaproteobacteria bacterium]
MSMDNDEAAPKWPERLRRRDASVYLRKRYGVERAPATLAKLAATGGGPDYELFGRIPYYRPVKLDEWVLSQLRLRRSTSDRGAPHHVCSTDEADAIADRCCGTDAIANGEVRRHD